MERYASDLTLSFRFCNYYFFYFIDISTIFKMIGKYEFKEINYLSFLLIYNKYNVREPTVDVGND